LGDLDGLVASIREHGILQPLIVSAITDEQFSLIAGERRFAAAKNVGLDSVPAIVRSLDQHRRLEVQLVENLHRKDLNPVEEALALERLANEFGLSQRDLAKRLGKSTTAVNQTLRILSLPKEILADNPSPERLSRSVLLEMVKLDSVDAQLAFWRENQEGKPTVRQARERRTRPQGGPANYKFRKIRVPGASVLVTVEKEYGSVDDLRNALEAALMTITVAA
jgi:ParB family chromosome partitioning protein